MAVRRRVLHNSEGVFGEGRRWKKILGRRAAPSGYGRRGRDVECGFSRKLRRRPRFAVAFGKYRAVDRDGDGPGVGVTALIKARDQLVAWVRRRQVRESTGDGSGNDVGSGLNSGDRVRNFDRGVGHV